MSNSLKSHGLYSPWNSPGQDTGVGSHPLLPSPFSQPRDRTQVSHIAGGFFTKWATKEALLKFFYKKRQRNKRSNRQHLLDHQKSKRVPEKLLFLLYWLCQSLWLCGSQQTGKFLKRWEYQATWPASWEICLQVKEQQLELNMEQTGSKSGKGHVKAAYCHPAYLTYAEYIMRHAGQDESQAGI